MALVTEVWSFIRKRKKFWLLPVLLIMLAFGLFLVLSASSPLAPFIYTIF